MSSSYTTSYFISAGLNCWVRLSAFIWITGNACVPHDMGAFHRKEIVLCSANVFLYTFIQTQVHIVWLYFNTFFITMLLKLQKWMNALPDQIWVSCADLPRSVTITTNLKRVELFISMPWQDLDIRILLHKHKIIPQFFSDSSLVV